MMRRGESFHGIAGGGRILARISSDVSLSISVHKAPYIREAYTIKTKRKLRESREIRPREEVGRKNERERRTVEELEGRLSYIGRRSCVCITRE